MALLASTLITPGATLWTLDRRLADLSARLGVAYNPKHHITKETPALSIRADDALVRQRDS